MSDERILATYRIRCTDDPIDALAHHAQVAGDLSFEVQILPAWRPDRALAVEAPASFNAWVDQLGQVAEASIRDFDSYLEALRRRHDFFHQMGCRLSDHGLETLYADDDRHTQTIRDGRARASGSWQPGESRVRPINCRFLVPPAS